MGSWKNRKSPRLSNYRYDSPNFYFVTICTYRRQSLFGEIGDSELKHNKAGLMITRSWLSIATKFKNVFVDRFVVMPNHLHAILELANLNNKENPPPSLSMVIHWFKTMTTNEYIREVKLGEYPRFRKKIWQRSYYDHIIRNELTLQRIREYIFTNPDRWSNDRYHPLNNKQSTESQFR